MKSPESQFAPQPDNLKGTENVAEVRPEKTSEISEPLKIEPKNIVKDRLKGLNAFQPSGDQGKDIETFLKLTGRERYLDDIKSGRIDAQTLLSEIKDFQKQSLDPNSEFYRELKEDDPEFQKKSEFYRDIPAVEIASIDSILQGRAGEKPVENEGRVDETKEKEDKNKEEEEPPENREKRERLEQISERVENGFESAKGRMFSFEQRYDKLYSTAIEKFTKLSDRYPNIISQELLSGMEQKNERVKDAYANMFVIYESGNNRLQSTLESLPPEFLTMEQIDSIDASVDKIFETIDRGEEKIAAKLDYLELTVDKIPSVREARKGPEKVKKAEEEIEESELIGKKAEKDKDIELNQ